jgi:hypothetical protein
VSTSSSSVPPFRHLCCQPGVTARSSPLATVTRWQEDASSSSRLHREAQPETIGSLRPPHQHMWPVVGYRETSLTYKTHKSRWGLEFGVVQRQIRAKEKIPLHTAFYDVLKKTLSNAASQLNMYFKSIWRTESICIVYWINVQ